MAFSVAVLAQQAELVTAPPASVPGGGPVPRT